MEQNMIMNNEDRYAIFGTGMSAFSFMRSFPDFDYLFYLDNNPGMQNTLHNDFQVLPPSILDKTRIKILKTISLRVHSIKKFQLN